MILYLLYGSWRLFKDERMCSWLLLLNCCVLPWPILLLGGFSPQEKRFLNFYVNYICQYLLSYWIDQLNMFISFFFTSFSQHKYSIILDQNYLVAFPPYSTPCPALSGGNMVWCDVLSIIQFFKSNQTMENRNLIFFLTFLLDASKITIQTIGGTMKDT